MGKIIGLTLGITLLVLLFFISPLLILFGWNNVGNEVLGWPRIDIFHAIFVWLSVAAVGATFRGYSTVTKTK